MRILHIPHFVYLIWNQVDHPTLLFRINLAKHHYCQGSSAKVVSYTWAKDEIKLECFNCGVATNKNWNQDDHLIFEINSLPCYHWTEMIDINISHETTPNFNSLLCYHLDPAREAWFKIPTPAQKSNRIQTGGFFHKPIGTKAVFNVLSH